MKVHLIRHGLTVPGEEGRYQGFLDEGLSAKGRAALLTAPQHPSRVYVSPARRARQTAAILYPAAEQICVPGLQEMNFGVFEGYSLSVRAVHFSVSSPPKKKSRPAAQAALLMKIFTSCRTAAHRWPSSSDGAGRPATTTAGSVPADAAGFLR